MHWRCCLPRSWRRRERQHSKLDPHSLSEIVHLLLLALPELHSSERGPLRKRVLGQAACALDHGFQRLTRLDRVCPREAHLAHEHHAFLVRPL